MDLVATTLVSDHAVHARYADRPDMGTATLWFEFHVPLAELDLPGRWPSATAEAHFINQAKIAALRHLYRTIGSELARLQDPSQGQTQPPA